MKKCGAQQIVTERNEQFFKHGRTVDEDDKKNYDGQLTYAASVLLIDNPDREFMKPPKNWDEDYWKKLIHKQYKERLVIAGALIAAEIDRIQF